MDIFDYVEEYGKYTFEEKKFNEVDNVVFSALSYANYTDIVSKNSENKITIGEASKLFFEKNKSSFFDVIAVKTGIKLLKKVADVKRYKDILMYNYKHIGNNECQFSAVTFEINDKICYVAFEGTDELISGWREDCMMSYQFPVMAQEYAIGYLNKNFTFNTKRLIVGGHSKGGNLALVASMYCNFLTRCKIKKIYNNDGPGLRKEEFKNKYYYLVRKKYIHIIPNYSIVGLLLCHDDDYVVVKSAKKGFLAHSSANWLIEDNHFVKDNLSKTSIVFEKGFSEWIKKFDYEKRKLFVDGLFKSLDENNITSIVELKKDINLILKLVKSTKNIDPIVEEMLKELFSLIAEANKEYTPVEQI